MAIVFVHMSNNVTSQSVEEARIIDKTRQAITAHGLQKTYVKTTAVDKAIEALNQYNIVIIMGKVGSGKSTLTLEIAKHFKIKYNEDVLLLDNPEWLQVIRYQNKQVVILEDVFGKEKPHFHEDIHGRFLESIRTCLQLNKTKVILTTRQLRRNSLDELVYKHLHKIPSTVIVDLDERFKLSRNQKRQILQSHMVANNITSFSKTEKFLKNKFHSYQTCSKDQIEVRRQVLDEIFLQEISDIDTLLGFPLTCHLFCINRAYTALGATFFRNPNAAIFDEVQLLRKNGKRNRHIGLQYSVLVYTMLISNFIPKNVKLGLLLKIYHTVYGYNEKEFLDHDLVDAVEDLNGLFLIPNKEKDGYILQHQTIQEAIVLSFGALCNDSINLLVKFCNWKDLMAYARPLSYKADANERIIRLNPHHYPLILKRYIAEDFNFKVRRIGRSLCPGMTKEMVDVLVRIMLSPIGDVGVSAGDNVYFYLARECDISIAQFVETISKQMLHEMSYSTFHSIDEYGNSFLHYWILEDFPGKSDLFREIFNKHMELMLVVNSLKYSPVHFAIYTGWFSIVSEHIWDWGETFIKEFKEEDIYDVRHVVRSLVASNIYSIGLKQQIACSLKAMQSSKRNLAIMENVMRIVYAFNNYTSVAALENGSVHLNTEVKDIRFMVKSESILILNLNNNDEKQKMAIFVDGFKLQCVLSVEYSNLEDKVHDVLKGMVGSN